VKTHSGAAAAASESVADAAATTTTSAIRSSTDDVGMQVDEDSKVADTIQSILQSSCNTPNSAISMKRLCKKARKQLPTCSELDVSRAIVSRSNARSVRVYWHVEDATE